MKLKLFKQIAFLLMAGVVGMGAGAAIMWGVRGVSAAEESGHGHELIYHAGTEATCEATGLKGYWECPECNLYYSDVDGINEIKTDDFDAWRVIAKTNHKTHYYAYKNATCAEDGHIAYYVCYGCGKLFSDEKCQHEVTYEDTIIHNYNREHQKVLIASEEPTCEHDGHSEHYVCTSCGQVFNEHGVACNYSDVVIKGGHHSDESNYTAYAAATCEHDGHVAYYSCADCGKKFADVECKKPLSDSNVIVERKEHWSESNQHVHEKAATCKEDGTPEYWVCVNGCGQKFVDQQCTELLDETLFDAYKKTNHHNDEGWHFVFDPSNLVDGAAYRYENDLGEVVTVDARYAETCIYCGEKRGNQPVRSFAYLSNNTFNNTNVVYSYETVGANKILDYDVFTINFSAAHANIDGSYDIDIIIDVAANYSDRSNYQSTLSGVVTDMSADIRKIATNKYAMVLNIHFDAVLSSNQDYIWNFDWDGDGVKEQKIKVVVIA